MRYNENNLIMKMTFQFALDIVELADVLQEKRKFVVADQLLRSGCSIGANVKEAQNAESKADFIHKMKVAAKEADENEFWLMLCKHAKNYPFEEKLESQLEAIMKVLNKIISTSKKK